MILPEVLSLSSINLFFSFLLLTSKSLLFTARPFWAQGVSFDWVTYTVNEAGMNEESTRTRWILIDFLGKGGFGKKNITQKLEYPLGNFKHYI